MPYVKKFNIVKLKASPSLLDLALNAYLGKTPPDFTQMLEIQKNSFWRHRHFMKTVINEKLGDHGNFKNVLFIAGVTDK